MGKFRRNKRTRRNIKSIVNRKTNITILLIILFIVISICIILTRISIDKINIAKKEQINNSYINQILYISEEEIYKEQQAISEMKKEVSVNIISLGNIMCETPILQDGLNENGLYDFSHIYEDIKKYTLGADLVIGNLETCFTTGEYLGVGKYNSPKQFAKDLKNIGVDLLNTANNNSFNYGKQGVTDTIDTLKEVGIEVVGTKYQGEESIVIKQIDGIEIAFLSYTYGLNGINNITEEQTNLVNVISKDKILKDLKQVENTDYICVNMHWGENNLNKPSQQQQELADFLFENGADIILGTHSPYLQPMEVKKNNKEEDVFVAYSIGSFISTSGYRDENVEMILDIKITKDIDGNTYLNKITYTPIYLLDNGKEVKNRYKLLDVKEEIKIYESGNINRINKKIYENLLIALENIKNEIEK